MKPSARSTAREGRPPRGARAFAAVLALAALAACHRAPAPAKDTAPAALEARPPRLPRPPAGPAIYPLDISLRGARAERVPLDVFRGHPVVIAMFYASCPSACPLLVSHVKAVNDALPVAARRDTRVLLVSFDPEHDAPEVLRAVRERHGLDDRFDVATGADDDVRQLAAALDVTYRALPGGGFSHTSVLTALDRDGRIVARVEGADPDLAPIVDAVRAVEGE